MALVVKCRYLYSLVKQHQRFVFMEQTGRYKFVKFVIAEV